LSGGRAWYFAACQKSASISLSLASNATGATVLWSSTVAQ
jgi:hypothetical protein